jgi:hypothetical protein
VVEPHAGRGKEAAPRSSRRLVGRHLRLAGVGAIEASE